MKKYFNFDMVFLFLIQIKEKSTFIWVILEKVNELLFVFLYYKKIHENLIIQLYNNQKEFHYRYLNNSDISAIIYLSNTLEPENSSYFEPHDFTRKAIAKKLKNDSFVMLGAFNKNKLIGYFFLRCGFNKKCFVGRLVHPLFQKKGVGHRMNQIMYNTAWNSGFRVFATLSSVNKLVMQSHTNNQYMNISQKLHDNYLLVEFIKPS